MENLSFIPFPFIRTQRLLLRQIKHSDLNDIFFLRSDERVMKYLDRPRDKSTSDTYEFIQKIIDAEKNNEGITWAITLKNKIKLIGTIGFWRIQKEHYRAEIGYTLHPDFWGKGIMREALSEVVNYGFNVMKLHSIEANVNPDNTSSIKLLERNGFWREAYYKENYFFNGKFIDTVIYSLLIDKNKK
ncbi:MAG TPA: GNAT family N-acetyltransferase [Ignavibacteriaceae bacterium]|nr:GNAT family N-acetyltransferase [Ignavibacteriaceae bacterium]